MTKNEAKILEYVKNNETAEHPVPKNDILNNFLKYEKIPAEKTEDRVNVLLRFGYISSKPLDDYVKLTSLGLHELDEYFETKSRIDKLESDTALAQKISCINLLIAAGSLGISIISLLMR